mgnify:CR=1 FL=1
MEGDLVFTGVALEPFEDAVEFGDGRGVAGACQREGEFSLHKLRHLGSIKAGQSGHRASRSAVDGEDSTVCTPHDNELT